WGIPFAITVAALSLRKIGYDASEVPCAVDAAHGKDLGVHCLCHTASPVHPYKATHSQSSKSTAAHHKQFNVTV
ncbi:hypothetical protein M9458_046371, partial [Cirrhinus mrigala]